MLINKVIKLIFHHIPGTLKGMKFEMLLAMISSFELPHNDINGFMH